MMSDPTIEQVAEWLESLQNREYRQQREIDRLCARVGELAEENRQLRELTRTDGEWGGPEDLRAEIAKADAWKRRADQMERERDRALLQATVHGRDRVWHVERVLELLDWLDELVGVAAGQGGCSDCDGDGWDRWTCGEDTCLNEAPCEQCNRAGLRTSVRDHFEYVLNEIRGEGEDPDE